MRYLWEMYILYAPLIYLAMFLAGVVAVIAIWRGMKALVSLADSMKRMADAAERGNRQA